MAKLLICVYILLAMLCQTWGQTKCNNATCLPTVCYCAVPDIPGGLPLEVVPQMILFSFNGAVTPGHSDLINDIFSRKRRNPNGTPIRMTMFVSDERETTDYCTVEKLWSVGHEISSFGVEQRISAKWWSRADKDDWEKEIDGEKQYIFGNSSIPIGDIVGFRNPRLQTGGNEQYEFAEEKQYVYDSSIVLPLLNRRVWPYTMDFTTEFPCYTDPCPDKSFPNFWQIPVQPLRDRNGVACFYIDECVNKVRSANELYHMLTVNFNSSYLENRAPLMINLLNYKSWFEDNSWAKQGLEMFIEMLLEMPDDDVWFVTYRDMIGWMKEPTPLRQITYFAPFSRTKKPKPECKEERTQLKEFGRWILIIEFIVCVVAFIYLYVEDRK